MYQRIGWSVSDLRERNKSPNKRDDRKYEVGRKEERKEKQKRGQMSRQDPVSPMEYLKRFFRVMNLATLLNWLEENIRLRRFSVLGPSVIMTPKKEVMDLFNCNIY